MGMKTIPLVLAALVLALLGVLYLALTDSGPERAVEPAGEVLAEVTATPPELEPEGPPESAEAPGASSDTNRTIAEADVELLTISTVERGTGRPIAGARVWVTTWSALRERCPDNGRGESYDIEAEIAALTKPFETDELGAARVPLPSESTIAIARHGDLFGTATDSPEPGSTVEIELAPDRSLTIRAVDERGQPFAGVPVGINEHDPNRPASGMMLWWAHTSGEEGEVTVFHVDHSMNRALVERALVKGARWQVTLATPHPDPPVVHINPLDLPDEPVLLTVARGGRVVVNLEYGQGAPISHLYVYMSEVLEERDSLGRRVASRRHNRTVRDGVAVFEHVAPGLQLQFRTASHEYRPVEEVHAGPNAAGEETTIGLFLADQYPAFTGTLVDLDGEPVADRFIDLRASLVPGQEEVRPPLSSGFRTDKRGKFEGVVKTRQASNRLGELVLTTDEGYEGTTLEALIPLGGRPHGGETDLGEVIMHPPKLILTGRVIDARGAPLYWSDISVRRMRDPDEPPGPPYTWIEALHTQTDHDGHFELTGELPAGEYRLDADQDGYVRRCEIPIQHGMRELEIILLQEGGLKGSLVLPDDIPPTWLRIDILKDGGKSRRLEKGDWVLSHPAPDGTFLLGELEPGTYDVLVLVPAWRTPLLLIEDVLVEGGVVRDDPRLSELDLRNRLHRVDVEVKGTAGEAVPLGYVTFAPDGEDDSRVGFIDCIASLLAATPSVDAVFTAPGYRREEVLGVSDGARVTLARGIPVRLKLPRDFEMPDPSYSVLVDLQPSGGDLSEYAEGVYTADGERIDHRSPRQAGDRATFDAGGEALLHVGGPGSWRVSWTIKRDGWPDFRMYRNAKDYPKWLEVGEKGVTEPVEVCPDLERLRRRLEALGD